MCVAHSVFSDDVWHILCTFSVTCVAHNVFIDAMCGTYCACLAWRVWHILCMFSVMCVAHSVCLAMPCVAHTGPFLFSNVSRHTSSATAVCPDSQQPVCNLSTLSVIDLLQLCCKVSAKDLPGTLQWSLLIFYVVVVSTASCTMQGNCFCFVDVLCGCVFYCLLYHAGELLLFCWCFIYSYYLNSEITGDIWTVSAMRLFSPINQLLHSLSCVGQHHTLQTFVLCLCMYICLPPTCFHAFLLPGSCRTSADKCRPDNKVGIAQYYNVICCYLYVSRWKIGRQKFLKWTAAIIPRFNLSWIVNC
jgi:hypothetical protein